MKIVTGFLKKGAMEAADMVWLPVQIQGLGRPLTHVHGPSSVVALVRTTILNIV